MIKWLFSSYIFNWIWKQCVVLVYRSRIIKNYKNWNSPPFLFVMYFCKQVWKIWECINQNVKYKGQRLDWFLENVKDEIHFGLLTVFIYVLQLFSQKKNSSLANYTTAKQIK